MLHKQATPENVHVPYAWSFADAAARTATTECVAEDIGKLAVQMDGAYPTLWMLTSIAPLLWAPVSSYFVMLPPSGTTIGGVYAGPNITIDPDGRISAANDYVLPTATAAVLGGVKQGSNTTIAPDGTISTPMASVQGRTGAVVITQGDVGLSNVDNTNDLAKPISTLTQAALALKTTDSTLAVVAKTGDYDDLLNQPVFPTKLSDLANDVGYLTSLVGGTDPEVLRLRNAVAFGINLY